MCSRGGKGVSKRVESDGARSATLCLPRRAETVFMKVFLEVIVRCLEAERLGRNSP